VKVNTKNFGEIEIEESKLIAFERGIIGYPELVHFALIHDEEQEDNAGIRWLQSIEEPAFALPVMDPLYVKEGYNPKVDDELLKPLCIDSTDDMLVLVTVTAPKDIENLSVNLCGPIIINAEKRLAAQVIVEKDEYPVHYPIYELLKNRKKAGE
jgi:flagellar assembly factor FliW